MYFVIVLMQDLTAKTKSQQIKGKKDQVAKIVYTEEGNGKVRQSLEYVDGKSKSKQDLRLQGYNHEYVEANSL